MIYLHKVTRMFIAAIAGVLACLCLLPLTAAAQGSPPPLPLPDVTLYGKITQRGEVLGEGSVKALLPDGTAVTAAITPIRGTDYNYALVVPLYMTATQTLAHTPGALQTGDTISLFVNDRPAFYQDGATQLTMNQLKILGQQPAKTAAGRSYELNLSTGGPESYLIGDVNANGLRNAADAMLTLKYDIGLIIGVTNFPPGPNTVYLPLCDIVANGRCDSSDALRILQCDVGMNGVSCPVHTIPTGLRTAQNPTSDAALRLHVAAAKRDDSTVDVRVQLLGGGVLFGAASLEIQYDPSIFAPVSCNENPTAAYDIVTCNPTFAPGAVRFNAISAQGATDGADLIELHFQRIGAVDGELSAHFTLTADGVTDQAGNDLSWSYASAEDSPSGPAWLYLPVIDGQSTAPAQAEESAEMLPVTEHTLYLPSINSDGVVAADAAEEAIPDAAPVEESAGDDAEEDTPAPVETPVANKPEDEDIGADAAPAHLLYLPLVDDE